MTESYWMAQGDDEKIWAWMCTQSIILCWTMLCDLCWGRWLCDAMWSLQGTKAVQCFVMVLERRSSQIVLWSGRNGRVPQASRLWSSGSACCVSGTCNAVEYLLQASKAVRVFAGQQNLTEWLKEVMRSYEPGGVIQSVILCWSSQLDCLSVWSSVSVEHALLKMEKVISVTVQLDEEEQTYQDL